jgi:hypothetical protein
MTWHHLYLTTLGVLTGIVGAFVPPAAAFTTPAAWALIAGSLGNATIGRGLGDLVARLAAAAKVPPVPPAPPSTKDQP